MTKDNTKPSAIKRLQQYKGAGVAGLLEQAIVELDTRLQTMETRLEALEQKMDRFWEQKMDRLLSQQPAELSECWKATHPQPAPPASEPICPHNKLPFTAIQHQCKICLSDKVPATDIDEVMYILHTVRTRLVNPICAHLISIDENVHQPLIEDISMVINKLQQHGTGTIKKETK